MADVELLAEVLRVYEGSNGDATKALYARLDALGPAGKVCTNLFRACKCSERAKVYSRGYRDSAYDRKQWSMENLCTILTAEAATLGISWGWGIDDKAKAEGSPHHHVLYVETECGQVSFHTDTKGAGPDYGRPWDGVRNASPGRVCGYAAHLLRGRPHPADQVGGAAGLHIGNTGPDNGEQQDDWRP